ncbi:MAG: site-specific DNA-methyltransferase [Christensenellales bacterium]
MSTNISKKKRDDLLDKIKQIRAFIAAAPQDENTGNLLSYLSELEKDVNGKKYGLVFEEHREEIDEVLDTHTPVLTEDADLFIDHGGQMNFLLEGDNLAALKLLEKTHRGKVKMIYIDPPYNTANKDFAYDDTRVDLTDTFRHSKWLSFMRERLRIARNLLRDDGILFISIDDNEQSDLKLLCDEIFKEENFFSQVIIQSNKRGQTYKQIAKTHEYLLIYTRSPEAEFNEIDKTDDDNDLNLLDKIGAYNVRELRNRNPKFGKHNRPNLFYPIYVNPSIVDKDGFCPISLAYTTDYCVEVYPFNSTGGESCWRWSTKLLSENINSNTQFSNVVARAKRDGTFNIYEKYRKTTYKAKSIWLETDVITEKGTVELGELGLSERFPFPKPLFLLKKCLQIGTNSNDIILDFFAGSGTTGHAVMKLNAEDGGTRRFILCTNNENGICRDVTYERIRRVIDKEDYAASLKYYKVDYVPISDRMYYEYADELLRHIRELVELENGINFTGNEEIAIVLTDEELEIFLDDEGIYKRCRKLYMGHDVLLDAQQAQALQEYNIAVNVIPDYYYKELEG